MTTYKGKLDCSTNPLYPGGTAGDRYHVLVAGMIGGPDGTAVNQGDVLECVVTAATGTRRAVGHNWKVVQATGNDKVLAAETVVDGDIVVFDGTTGRLIKDGGKKVADFTLAPVAAPAAATSAGVAGTWAYAAGFLYICVATDTWKRVVIAAW